MLPELKCPHPAFAGMVGAGRNQAGQQGNQAITSERYPGLHDQRRNDRGSGSLSQSSPSQPDSFSCWSSQQDPIEGDPALLPVEISGCRSEPSEALKLAAVPTHPSQIATRMSSGPFEFPFEFPVVGTFHVPFPGGVRMATEVKSKARKSRRLAPSRNSGSAGSSPVASWIDQLVIGWFLWTATWLPDEDLFREVASMSKPTRILYLASNPKNTGRLQLDNEIREIREKITASSYRDTIDLVSQWALRPDDLLQELMGEKPDVVHFSGHGTPSGELVLEDESGLEKTVGPAVRPFTTLKDNIKLVFLNACYTRIQGDAIAEVIDCVVGTNTAIADKAAIRFAATFDRAIGFGVAR